MQEKENSSHSSSTCWDFFRVSPTFLFPWSASCVWVTLRMWLYPDVAARVSVTGIHSVEEEDVGHLEGRARERHRLSCVDKRHYMIIPCVRVGVLIPAVLSREGNALMWSNITKPFYINSTERCPPVQQVDHTDVVRCKVILVQLWRMQEWYCHPVILLPSILKKKHPTFPGQEFQSLNDSQMSKSIDYTPLWQWESELMQEGLCGF